MHLVCPRLTRANLVSDLTALGLSPGDTVMVHVSLRAVGELLGGPTELTESLLAALGPAGTVMVYLGAPSPFDDVGRGCYDPADEDFILAHCPAFDPRHTPASRDFGAYAEFFRGHPRVRCSSNPGARMAAAGAHADELTRDHPRDYGLGDGSPLARLVDLGGKVLLLGSDLDQVTLLHYAEARAPIPGKRTVRVRVPALVHGERVWHDAEEFDSSNGIVDWPDRFFASITEAFLAAGHARTGLVGRATSHLIDARTLVDFAVPIMVRTAAALR